MVSQALKGYCAVTVAAVLWASNGTAGKSLLCEGMRPSDLVQVRVTVASLVLGAFLAIYRRDLLRIPLRDVPYLFFLGGVIMALVQLTYFYTISLIQVVAAILLQYLSPVLVAAFSICFWGERLTLAKGLALVFALLGCYLVVGGYNLDVLRMNRIGVLAGLVAAVLYAAYALLDERAMRTYAPWTVVFYALFFAAISWHVIHPPLRYVTAGYSLTTWAWLLYIGIVGTIFPFGLYFVGINYVRSTRAMIIATMEPICAGFMAYFFLGETLETLQILGAGMVLGAIVLLQVRQEHDVLTPEALRTGQVRGE